MTHAIDSRTIHDAIYFLQRVCAKGPDEERLLSAVAKLQRSLSTPLNKAANGPVIPSPHSVSQ